MIRGYFDTMVFSKTIIMTSMVLMLAACDKTQLVEESDALLLPNQQVTIKEQQIYYQDKPYSGVLIGYDFASNPECPSKLTVDVNQGAVEGRVQWITMEDIDSQYRIKNGKLNGQSSVFIFNVLFDNDEVQSCSFNTVDPTNQMAIMQSPESLDQFCQQIKQGKDELSYTKGQQVISTTFRVIERINQSQQTRKDINPVCNEIYKLTRFE